MERGDLGRFDCVEDEVLAGKSLLWVAGMDGVAVTQLALTEKSKVCTIIAMGGSISTVPLISTIEEFAKAEGCDCVRIFGRKGWLRVLHGYSAPKVILEKRLK